MLKIGDKVECVNAKGWDTILTQGKVYIVQGVCGNQVRIITDNHRDSFLNECRFVKVEEKRDAT